MGDAFFTSHESVGLVERARAVAAGLAIVIAVAILGAWVGTRPQDHPDVESWDYPPDDLWPESAWRNGTGEGMAGPPFANLATIAPVVSGPWEAEAVHDDLVYLDARGKLVTAPACVVFVTDAAGRVPLLRFARKADGRWHLVTWHGVDVAPIGS